MLQLSPRARLTVASQAARAAALSFVILAIGPACGGSSTVAIQSTPAPARALPAPNNDPPEATLGNAAAEECTVDGPVQLVGADNPDVSLNGGSSLQFGAWGGLLVWSEGRMLRAQLLARTGEPVGQIRSLAALGSAKPEEIIAVDGGFVVLAVDWVTAPAMCEKRCADAACFTWQPEQGARPITCSYTCIRPCDAHIHNDLRALFVPIEPGAGATGAVKPLGYAHVAAASSSEGRSFLVLTTDNELVTGHVNDANEVGLPQREVTEPVPYILPVRGEGRPSFVLADSRGAALLVDAAGQYRIEGAAMASGGLDVLNARLQARWGTDGQIHLAWNAWLKNHGAYQFAVLGADHQLRSEGEIAFADKLHPPFEDYVVAWVGEGAEVERRSWTRERVGKPFDLAARDPAIASESIVQAWSGERFVFVYSRKDDRRTLWMQSALCR